MVKLLREVKVPREIVTRQKAIFLYRYSLKNSNCISYHPKGNLATRKQNEKVALISIELLADSFVFGSKQSGSSYFEDR